MTKINIIISFLVYFEMQLNGKEVNLQQHNNC